MILHLLPKRSDQVNYALPLMKPTTDYAEYYGVIEIIMCTSFTSR